MNSKSENLLSAVDILVEGALSKLKYDKTIQAEIESIADLDVGGYNVRYSGNVFSAFAADTSRTYRVGDNVYVNVPEGDFSAKKIITSKVNEQSLSYGEMISLSNSISQIGPDFAQMYGTNWNNSYGVVAGGARSEVTIFEGEKNALFQQYARQAELIRISSSFLTQFYTQHSYGNYGIIVEFYTLGDDIVTYTLDLNSFNGDPYGYKTWAPQEAIIQIYQNFLTGIKSIKLFEENFTYDRFVKDGQVTDIYNTDVANIFAKDVSLSFVQRKNLTNNLYYLDIATPQGTLLSSSIDEIDLVGRLIYEGDNILNSSTCTCQWYERDLSVIKSHEMYDKNAGVGWRPIAAAGFNRLTVKYEDVIYQKDYKLVVVYNDKVVLSDEQSVMNTDGEYSFTIEQRTVNEIIQLQLIDNIKGQVYTGNWYILYPDGSYNLVAANYNLIDITDLLKYFSVTFYCGVRLPNSDDVICFLEHKILAPESDEDVTISYTGEDYYRYDANGDVTIEDSERARTLAVNLNWKQGSGSYYDVYWYGPDDIPLTEVPYNPSDSMLENLWVDTNFILHYTIKQKYKSNYNNNNIKIIINTIDNKEYIFNKEILFIKDGDQGTNGTTYVAAIRPYDTNTGLKLSGFQSVVYYEDKKAKSLPLRCFVYKDGELINDSTAYNIEYKWDKHNLEYDIYEDTATINAITDRETAAYIKVQVNINNETSIYAIYPIDVLVNHILSPIQGIDISSIPSYIKYTTSGTLPYYYNDDIKLVYQDKEYTEFDILTPELFDIKDNKLKPTSNFIFENNSIGLLAYYSQDFDVYHPIVMYLDTYGNEAINGWDGTSIETENGHILAPQIGAGEKDEANRFTGVVMGKDTQQKQIGLYGYQSGINTFGLTQDGKAYFGIQGRGRIDIDGTSASIVGGGGGDSENGMTLILAATDKDTKAIQIANDNFFVTYGGHLEAQDAKIHGIIEAESGYIGGRNGWIIEEYRIYNNSGGSSRHIELNSNFTLRENGTDLEEAYAFWAGAEKGEQAAARTFAVSKDGQVFANSGKIGDWTLDKYSIQSSDGTVGLAHSSSAAFWAGTGLDRNSSTINANLRQFLVTRQGVMKCSNAEITGTITATYLKCDNGLIGGWTISESGISRGSTSLTSIGLSTDTIYINGLGTLGLTYGEDDDGKGNAFLTYNLGIDSSDYGKSIVLQSGKNISLNPAAGGAVWFQRGLAGASGAIVNFSYINTASSYIPCYFS